MNDLLTRYYELRFDKTVEVPIVVNAIREHYTAKTLVEPDGPVDYALRCRVGYLELIPDPNPTFWDKTDALVRLAFDTSNATMLNSAVMDNCPNIVEARTLGDVPQPVCDGLFRMIYQNGVNDPERQTDYFEFAIEQVGRIVPDVEITTKLNKQTPDKKQSYNLSIYGKFADVELAKETLAHTLQEWDRVDTQTPIQEILVENNTELVLELDLLIEKYGEYNG